MQTVEEDMLSSVLTSMLTGTVLVALFFIPSSSVAFARSRSLRDAAKALGVVCIDDDMDKGSFGATITQNRRINNSIAKYIAHIS